MENVLKGMLLGGARKKSHHRKSHGAGLSLGGASKSHHRRQPNAWNLFVKAHFDTLKAQHPRATNGAILKKLGVAYRRAHHM